MRSTMAKGNWSLLRRENARFIGENLRSLSSVWAVTIYEASNNGNHLHLLIRAKDKLGFQGFLRALAGKIAQKVTGAKKGCALGTRFWDLPAYTRLIEWGRAFFVAKRYVIQNRLEAAGVIPYQPRTLRTKGKPSVVPDGGLSSRSQRRARQGT